MACTREMLLTSHFNFFNTLPFGLNQGLSVAVGATNLSKIIIVNSKYGLLVVNLDSGRIWGNNLPEGYYAVIIEDTLVVGRDPKVLLEPELKRPHGWQHSFAMRQYMAQRKCRRKLWTCRLTFMKTVEEPVFLFQEGTHLFFINEEELQESDAFDVDADEIAPAEEDSNAPDDAPNGDADGTVEEAPVEAAFSPADTSEDGAGEGTPVVAEDADGTGEEAPAEDGTVPQEKTLEAENDVPNDAGKVDSKEEEKAPEAEASDSGESQETKKRKSDTSGVTIPETVMKYLKLIVGSYTHSVCEIQRARIWILCGTTTLTLEEIAEEVGCGLTTVKLWKKRAVERIPGFIKLEQLNPKKVRKAVIDALQDNPRSGAPLEFSAEKVAEVMKTACTDPKTLGLPFGHWTITSLHAYCCGETALNGKFKEGKIFKKGEDEIIPSKSAIYDMLRRADLHPWNIEYYLHSADKYLDPEAFKAKVAEINKLYTEPDDDTDVFSVDEKTGMQAISPDNEDKEPVEGERKLGKKWGHVNKKGKNRKREENYTRHGTTTLTAALNTRTGKVIIGTLRSTRKEEDFGEALKVWISAKTREKLVIVLDNLNTHMSETAVRVVAEQMGLTEDLGEKGKSGHLKSMETRKAFLEDESHSIRFKFTPKHCSWLNQIEIFFGILQRNVTADISTESCEELEKYIRNFIEYHNEYRAHPYKWKKKGAMLAA